VLLVEAGGIEPPSKSPSLGRSYNNTAIIRHSYLAVNSPAHVPSQASYFQTGAVFEIFLYLEIFKTMTVADYQHRL
jgi:hypothetical protein